MNPDSCIYIIFGEYLENLLFGYKLFWKMCCGIGAEIIVLRKCGVFCVDIPLWCVRWWNCRIQEPDVICNKWRSYRIAYSQALALRNNCIMSWISLSCDNRAEWFSFIQYCAKYKINVMQGGPNQSFELQGNFWNL
jgi:hypothetical protein